MLSGEVQDGRPNASSVRTFQRTAADNPRDGGETSQKLPRNIGERNWNASSSSLEPSRANSGVRVHATGLLPGDSR